MTKPPEVKYFCISTRTNPIEFELSPDKKIAIFHIKDSLAKTAWNKIFIDDKFFEYSSDEHKAVIFHELYHTKWTTQLKRTFNIFRWFSLKKALYEEEFQADYFAARNASFEGMISFLEKSEKLYVGDKVIYDAKTHPTIKQRVQKLKEKRVAKK